MDDRSKRLCSNNTEIVEDFLAHFFKVRELDLRQCRIIRRHPYARRTIHFNHISFDMIGLPTMK